MASLISQTPSLRVPHSSALWDIQRHFFDRQFNAEELSTLIMGLASLVLVLLLAIIFIAFKNRRKPYIPEDWITNSKDIRDLIQLAIDQRTHFSIHFNPGVPGRRPALQCVGDRLDGNYMVVEGIGITALSSRWAARKYEGFFQVISKGQTRYFAFFGTVDKVFTYDGRCFLRLTIPAKLETRQKRSYLRIIPPPEYLLGAGIWHTKDLPAPEHRDVLVLWSKPSLVLLPPLHNQFSIHDISAGGMRVHIPHQYAPENREMLSNSEEAIVMLDLWDPDKSQRLRFWMLCRIQNLITDVESQELHLGMQFLNWARPREIEGGNDLEWLRLSRSGEIEALGDWIMRRHLEFFREADTEQM